jgi:hypothetical protein
MKRLIAAAALLFVFQADAQSPDVITVPQPDGSAFVIVSAEKMRACEEQGGCFLVSAQQVEAFVLSVKPKLCNQVEL